MTKFLTSAAIAALLSLPTASLAGDAGIMIEDAYARASSPAAKAGAAFMQIMNMTGEDDRLIAASSNASKIAQLHTHKDKGDGVMQMLHVEEGFELPAGETLTLQRGGNHVMLMGLNDPLDNGEVISVTLTFEKAGDVVVEIPVDLDRKPAHGHGGHGTHSN